jgi:SAM-dependent methyltransferase
MKQAYEAQYHLLEETHWWFLGRRQIVRSLVHSSALQLKADRHCHILEIGCSGGPLLKQLQADGYDQVTGIDISPDAIELCRQRGLIGTQVMDAQKTTFDDGSFDVIIASDVLEHLADAPQALREWHRLLRPGGRLIVFVPAFMFLWSRHDEANNHFRRYRRTELKHRLIQCGFFVQRSSYWNFSLFLPVALIRWVKRRFGGTTETTAHGDLEKPSCLINWLLSTLLSFENQLIRAGLNWPCGVSVMAVGQKPNPQAQHPSSSIEGSK